MPLQFPHKIITEGGDYQIPAHVQDIIVYLTFGAGAVNIYLPAPIMSVPIFVRVHRTSSTPVNIYPQAGKLIDGQTSLQEVGVLSGGWTVRTLFPTIGSNGELNGGWDTSLNGASQSAQIMAASAVESIPNGVETAVVIDEAASSPFGELTANIFTPNALAYYRWDYSLKVENAAAGSIIHAGMFLNAAGIGAGNQLRTSMVSSGLASERFTGTLGVVPMIPTLGYRFSILNGDSAARDMQLALTGTKVIS